MLLGRFVDSMAPIVCQVGHQADLGDEIASPDAQELQLPFCTPSHNGFMVIAGDLGGLVGCQYIGIALQNDFQCCRQLLLHGGGVDTGMTGCSALLVPAKRCKAGIRVTITRFEKVHHIDCSDGVLARFFA